MPGLEGQKLGRYGRYYLMHPLERGSTGEVSSAEDILMRREVAIHPLWQGSTGEVYRAEDTLMRREIAVKVFADDVLSPEAFFLKCAALRELDHPAILPLLDYSIEESTTGFFSPPVPIQKKLFYLVMPYCKDGSLEDWLSKREDAADSPFRPLSAQDTASMVYQIAGALKYAHNHSIVHGNIKPSNLLIEWNLQNPERPKVLVADFALDLYTPPRGTPPIYMAPEQIIGQPVPASDQYALAVVAFQMLMGKWNVTPVIMPGAFNRSIPRAVDAVLARALAGSPSERFASISDFAAALSQASGLSRASTDPSPAQQISSAPPFQGTPGFTRPQEESRSIPPDPSPPQEEPSSNYPMRPTPIQPVAPLQRMPSGPLSDFFKSMNELFERLLNDSEEQPANQPPISLFAIARAAVEKDDRAHVDKMYIVEAGIAQNKTQGFAGEAFTLPAQNPDEPVWFDILLHTSGNIEAARVWHTRLRYDLRNPEPQLVSFYFRFTAPGTGALAITFYHERRWLKTLHLEIETIEQPALGASEKRG